MLQQKILKKNFGKQNLQKVLIIIFHTNSKDPATIIFKTAMNEVMKTKRQSSAVQAARVERVLEISNRYRN